MEKFKQYRISDMIKILRKKQEEHGDLLVEMSVDEEGNCYHPIGDYIKEKDGKKEILIPFGIDEDKITIYPCE